MEPKKGRGKKERRKKKNGTRAKRAKSDTHFRNKRTTPWNTARLSARPCLYLRRSLSNVRSGHQTALTAPKLMSPKRPVSLSVLWIGTEVFPFKKKMSSRSLGQLSKALGRHPLPVSVSGAPTLLQTHADVPFAKSSFSDQSERPCSLFLLGISFRSKILAHRVSVTWPWVAVCESASSG